MMAKCKVCGKGTASDSQAARRIAFGICDACTVRMSAGNGELLEAIDTPVLLLQGNPRQVVGANRKALKLFGKSLREVEGHRGGEVFDCIHSFTEAGCGKDVNCENCTIKNAIVDTFNTGESHRGVSTTLQIRKASGTRGHVMQVSTEKAGDLALVRIERFDSDA